MKARRLKRVFGIEIDSGARCGGKLEVIASIEDPRSARRLIISRDDAMNALESHQCRDAQAPSLAWIPVTIGVTRAGVCS